MVIKLYVSTISFSQEIKKNQQRALMILESKNIPFVTIDITDPGQEDSKDYMNENAKPKGENKVPMTPQIFNEADYCGDFNDLDMANECDTLGDFLKMTDDQKKDIKIGITSLVTGDEEKSKDSPPLTNGVPTSLEETEELPVSEAVPDEPATEEEKIDLQDHPETKETDGEAEIEETKEELKEDVIATEEETVTPAVEEEHGEEEEEEEEEEEKKEKEGKQETDQGVKDTSA